MAASNIEILGCEPTPLGLLCLRRRELLSAPGTVVTEITLEHEYLMSSLQTDSERALATRALALHGGNAGAGEGAREGGALSVLVGGLGLGYTARAALTSERVARVVVVERLRPVIDWMERGLGPLASELTADPRLSVTEGDVYARLAGPAPRARDLILIDVDHSPDEPLDPENAWFYTAEGSCRVRRHLAPGGVLGVWSAAESDAYARALRTAFAEVRVEPVTFHNRLLDEDQTDWLFLARR